SWSRRGSTDAYSSRVAYLPNGGEHLFMQPARRRDHALIRVQSPAMREFQRFSMNIGDRSSRLLDDQHAAGVIPNLFDVVRPGGQAQVDIRAAVRDCRVLGLAIKPNRWAGNSELLGDPSGIGMGAMP